MGHPEISFKYEGKKRCFMKGTNASLVSNGVLYGSLRLTELNKRQQGFSYVLGF